MLFAYRPAGSIADWTRRSRDEVEPGPSPGSLQPQAGLTGGPPALGRADSAGQRPSGRLMATMAEDVDVDDGRRLPPWRRAKIAPLVTAVRLPHVAALEQAGLAQALSQTRPRGRVLGIIRLQRDMRRNASQARPARFRLACLLQFAHGRLRVRQSAPPLDRARRGVGRMRFYGLRVWRYRGDLDNAESAPFRCVRGIGLPRR
jgi:hypothetical protein